MIPVLRSIDSLLNQFDELSQRHANFLSNFDTNFPDVKNPLRDIVRTEEEQRKTTKNILLAVYENDDQMGSIGTVEDFNRRIIKNRFLHRPPSYSSNDGSFFHRVPSRTSSLTTESAPLPRISIHAVVKPNTPRPVASAKRNDIIKPKIVPQNQPMSRRRARSPVTAFTMNTVNRLSKPKAHHQSPDQKSITRRVQQRPKPYENIKKDASECSSPPSMRSLQIKRANTATIKPSSKKFKVDNKVSMETPKRIPSRPIVCLAAAAAPTIRLSFPMQPHQRSPRIVICPKTTSTKKTTTNKRSMTYSKTYTFL